MTNTKSKIGISITEGLTLTGFAFIGVSIIHDITFYMSLGLQTNELPIVINDYILFPFKLLPTLLLLSLFGVLIGIFIKLRSNNNKQSTLNENTSTSKNNSSVKLYHTIAIFNLIAYILMPSLEPWYLYLILFFYWMLVIVPAFIDKHIHDNKLAIPIVILVNYTLLFLFIGHYSAITHIKDFTEASITISIKNKDFKEHSLIRTYDNGYLLIHDEGKRIKFVMKEDASTLWDKEIKPRRPLKTDYLYNKVKNLLTNS